MTRPLRVAIVGYGIAGISAAIALRRLGHDVTHFERVAVQAPAGAGLLLTGAGLAALETLGLRTAALACGAVVTRIHGQTLRGRPVIDLRYDDLARGNHGLGIQRAALFDLLRSADPQAESLHVPNDIAAVDAEQGYLFERSGVRLGPFDLIVAADGVHSSVRSGLKGLVRRDRPYPWAAVVCLLDDPHGLGEDRVVQSFAGTRQVGVWPVGSRGSDAPRRVNVSINVPLAQAEGLRDIEPWKRYVCAVCPYIAPLLTQAAGTPELRLYTYRDVVLHRYHLGRVVLLGDAAHSMSPQLGQGVSLALLDALALAQALECHHDVAAALARFDQLRRPHAAACQRISRWMTPLFQSESRVLAMLRDRAFHPLSRLPGIRTSMLRVVTGQKPWLLGGGT